jgi:hypothetical protein
MVDLADDDQEDAPAPTPPPAATLLALEQQNNDALRTTARRYAESRLQLVRAAGCPIPKNYAQELVEDAIADTWLGFAKWDPERCSLLVHLRGEIRDRTFKDARRGHRYPRVAIDVAANDSHDATLIEQHLAHTGTSAIVLAALVSRIATELKVLAHADRCALAVLACWQQSIVEREHVLACTRMTRAEYKAARKRLLSLSKKLPPDLRDSAREFLRSAS